MPHIEKRTGNIVLRIVYDGAPEAGKTTNLLELVKSLPMKRRSQVVSPETTGRRTEFFDWATFMGGYVDGRKLKCQLVSVPGQPSLLRRRRYLLDTADAVVFVADSRPASLEANRSAFGLLQEAVKRRGGATPAGILLQANKQDLEESLTPTELARSLEVGDGVASLGAQAVHGIGVMQSFIAATRLATLRVQDLVSDPSGALTGAEESPEELLAELRRVEEELLAREVDASLAPSTRRIPSVESTGARPPLPVELSGHVWPLVEGRTIFAELLGGTARYVPDTEPWAPEGALEAQVSDGDIVRWFLHTCDAWSFQELMAAQTTLVSVVRQLRDLEPFLPPDRALLLQNDRQGLRIWMATRALPTLRETLSRLKESPSAEAVQHALAAITEALRLGETLESVGVRLSCLDSIGHDDGRAFVLSVPDDAGPRLRTVADELRELAAQGMASSIEEPLLELLEDR